jgi:hypothetical protein
VSYLHILPSKTIGETNAAGLATVSLSAAFFQASNNKDKMSSSENLLLAFSLV